MSNLKLPGGGERPSPSQAQAELNELLLDVIEPRKNQLGEESAVRLLRLGIGPAGGIIDPLVTGYIAEHVLEYSRSLPIIFALRYVDDFPINSKALLRQDEHHSRFVPRQVVGHYLGEPKMVMLKTMGSIAGNQLISYVNPEFPGLMNDTEYRQLNQPAVIGSEASVTLVNLRISRLMTLAGIKNSVDEPTFRYMARLVSYRRSKAKGTVKH